MRPPCTSFLLPTICTGRARTLIWYGHPLGHSVSRVTSCALFSHFDRYWNARFPCANMAFHLPDFSPSSRHT
ncbi:hypothetical protein BKA82DRAFT_4072688 [Pisolithus tinctorius]|nr:hypothetical protein BKA82DRAFT_4072688 [Pisolithus tinctorius]